VARRAVDARTLLDAVDRYRAAIEPHLADPRAHRTLGERALGAADLPLLGEAGARAALFLDPQGATTPGALLLLAQAHAASGQLEAALRDLDRALAATPGNAGLLGARAWVRLQHDDIAGAREDAEAAVAAHAMPRTYLTRAIVRAAAGDALGAVEDAARTPPDQDSDAARAEAYLAAGRAEDALAAAEDAARRFPRRAEVLAVLGEAQVACGETTGAEESFVAALDAAQTLRLRAARRAWAGLATLRAAVTPPAARASAAATFRTRAAARARAGAVEEAIDLELSALLLDDRADAWLRVARLARRRAALLGIGVAASLRAVRLEPDSPEVLGEQALAAYSWGTPGADAWRRALELDPRSPRGLQARWTWTYAPGDARGLEALARDLAPLGDAVDVGEVARLRATALRDLCFRTRDVALLAESRRILEGLVRADPGCPEWRHALACTLAASGEARAADEFEQAGAAQPLAGESWIRAADLRLARGEDAQAEVDYGRALVGEPTWTLALAGRALARAHRGDRAGALADAREARRRLPLHGADPERLAARTIEALGHLPADLQAELSGR
jgi:tetratricopeptide (TPR) repeat protein